MGTLAITDRAAFPRLPKQERRKYDLRTAFDPSYDGSLIACCIRPDNHNNGDSSPSMAIYHDGVFCRGCGSYWWPDEFLLELGDRTLEVEGVRSGGRIAAAPTPTKVVARTFCEWLTEGPYTDRLSVMHARGLRTDTLAANWIGHNGEGFTIPVWADWSLATIRYRRDDERSPERPKYWGTPGHNEPLLYCPITPSLVGPAPTQRTILCEGELDALRLAQEGYRAVSITNGSGAMSKAIGRLLPQLEAHMAVPGLLICTDQDRPGRIAGDLMGLALKEGGHDYAHLRWAPGLGKDVTDFLKRWPVAEFAKYVEEAEGCVFGK